MDSGGELWRRRVDTESVFPDVFNQTYPSEWTIWINHTESMTHGHVLVKCCSKKDEHNDINKC